MKKIILTAMAVFAFSFANAQDKKETSEGFAKGDVFVSGALTLSSSKTGDWKVNQFTIAPKAGYFVAENIAIGAMIGYTSIKIEDNIDSAQNTGFGVGAFGRYYFTPANKFSLFAELGVDYTSFDNEYNIDYTGDIDVYDSKSKEIGASLGAGLNYFVSSNFSIEAGVAALGFTSNDNGGGKADKTNTFTFGGDWTAVTFGVNYKF